MPGAEAPGAVSLAGLRAGGPEGEGKRAGSGGAARRPGGRVPGALPRRVPVRALRSMRRGGFQPWFSWPNPSGRGVRGHRPPGDAKLRRAALGFRAGLWRPEPPIPGDRRLAPLPVRSPDLTHSHAFAHTPPQRSAHARRAPSGMRRPSAAPASRRFRLSGASARGRAPSSSTSRMLRRDRPPPGSAGLRRRLAESPWASIRRAPPSRAARRGGGGEAGAPGTRGRSQGLSLAYCLPKTPAFPHEAVLFAYKGCKRPAPRAQAQAGRRAPMGEFTPVFSAAALGREPFPAFRNGSGPSLPETFSPVFHSASARASYEPFRSARAPLRPPPRGGFVRATGEVAEWSKAHAWKVCRRGTVSRVRIPLSPPESPPGPPLDSPRSAWRERRGARVFAEPARSPFAAAAS